MDDILKEFLTESGENLDHVERDLVALEETPDSRPLIAAIFRNIHTIKGSSGFLGLPKLEAVAHGGESLLSSLRDEKFAFNGEITNALLGLVDALRRMLAHLQAAGTETVEDFASLVSELKRLNSGDTALAVAPIQMPAHTPAVARISVNAASPVTAVAPSTTTASALAEVGTPLGLASDNNVRVDVDLLDKLMNLVGELVLARNQLIQITETVDDARVVTAAQRLNLVTTELQGEIMKTRLQPIGNVFTKFPRVVRDIAQEIAKRVRIEIEGKETELDRTIIEAIKDPLTHIVRNAVDHGIESPEKRRAAGKHEEGLLSMRAFHEGGQVIIEIRDDGRGIDVTRVKANAVDRGLITTDQSDRMSDHDACRLIFHPGLSTAEQITNISGRGVGMDVVKTNIEKIGGAIDILSELGKGTCIRIKIPLTLAIIPAIMIQSSGQRFAIPQVNLLELVRLDGDEAASGVETILGTPVHRLRGRLLPLVRLSTILKLDGQVEPSDGSLSIVVVQADHRQFGLIVDRVCDTQEIVVKPLGEHFKGVPAFAGATIMGDGRVALILDVAGIAEEARLSAKATSTATAAQAATAVASVVQRKRLLVFSIGELNRAAIDLSTVGRLEKLPRSLIERAGNREVVQYRDDVMELLRLNDVFGYPSEANDDELLHVIVHTVNGRSLGLVVGRILDIVEEQVRIQSDVSRRGVLGRAVIQGRVTEMLDVSAIVEAFDPVFAGNN